MGGSLPVHGRPVDPPVSFKPDNQQSSSKPHPLKHSSRALFLSAAILANLLLGSGAEDEAAYGPPETAYGAPEPVYEQPAESYEQPAETYGAPSSPPVTYEEPDTYGAPAADPVSYSAPLPSYGAPARF